LSDDHPHLPGLWPGVFRAITLPALWSAEGMKTCEWHDEGDYWHTECGNDFEIIDGTPIENNFQFCPYCGGELVDADDETEDDN